MTNTTPSPATLAAIARLNARRDAYTTMVAASPRSDRVARHLSTMEER